MSFAEDKHKVQRIVEGSWKQLQQLYRPALEVKDVPGQLYEPAETSLRQSYCWHQITYRYGRVRLDVSPERHVTRMSLGGKT